MTNSVYYLLGTIDNYEGGFSTEDKIFKKISYLGFDWKIDNEKILKCERLIKKCQNILVENKLTNDILIEKWDNDKGITIISKNLINIINNFIVEKNEWLGREYFEINKDIFEKFERWDKNSNSYKQRINFLYGVIDTNGDDNEFYFYNGYDKCLLTHYVLKCLADEDDKINLESRFKTPWVDKIAVNKDGEIWKKIIKKYRK